MNVKELEKRIVPVSNNETSELCAKCKNCCCTSYPCELVPSDVTDKFGFTLDYNGIVQMLKTGLFTIDYYWADPLMDKKDRKIFGKKYADAVGKRCLFIRMRSIDDSSPIANFNDNGGSCVLLTPKGCLMSFEKRPFNAQVLDPKTCSLSVSERIDAGIFDGFTKRELAILWLKYEDILNSVAKDFDKVKNILDDELKGD